MNFFDFREPVSAWSHCAGMMLAVPGTYLLWRRSAGETSKRLTLLVYGLTLAFCYLASTLYHGVRLPAAGIAAFARLDGVGIFALIAGSYTPLAWCLLRGHWRFWTLAAVWSVAGSATILIAAGRHFPPGLATCLYLGMGWGVVICYFEIARAVSHRALLPVVAGGLSYSVGAVLNLIHWPVFLPGDLRGSRTFSLLRARGQHGPLSLHPQGRGAVRSGCYGSDPNSPGSRSPRWLRCTQDFGRAPTPQAQPALSFRPETARMVPARTTELLVG